MKSMDGFVLRRELKQALRLLRISDLLPVHPVQLHALSIRLLQHDTALPEDGCGKGWGRDGAGWMEWQMGGGGVGVRFASIKLGGLPAVRADPSSIPCVASHTPSPPPFPSPENNGDRHLLSWSSYFREQYFVPLAA